MDEVLAAAERKRQHALNYDYEYRCTRMGADNAILADAALAAGLFPADDAEAVTNESLRADNWAPLFGSEWAYYLHDGLNLFVEVGDWYLAGFLARIEIDDSIRYLPHITTRGQLRQLLKAIGGGDGK
jgi:hypothetical protein